MPLCKCDQGIISGQYRLSVSAFSNAHYKVVHTVLTLMPMHARTNGRHWSIVSEPDVSCASIGIPVAPPILVWQ